MASWTLTECKIKSHPRWPINRLGDLEIQLDGLLGDPRPLPSKDIWHQQKQIHVLSNASSILLKIDRTTQPSSIGGPMVNQNLSLISQTALVNIDAGNGLLPDGTKPLPEPMLAYHK